MHDWVVPIIAGLVMVVLTIFFLVRIGSERRALAAQLSWLDDELSTAIDVAPHVPAAVSSRDPSTDIANGLWHEWNRTLVHSETRDRTYRTLDAEELFSAEQLAPGILRFRMFIGAPSIFTGAGVLFTFIGLAVGFNGLNLDSDATTADSIIASAGRLVAAAGIAFTASILGVLLSLVFNFVEKNVERQAVAAVSRFQRRLNSAYALTTPESALVRIAESQKQSTEALQELHERIGNRLQEALEQQSSVIRDELAASISSALAPAMSTLVEATTHQSSAVFETLVERFASSFTELGAQQRSAMDAAAGNLQAAIDGLGTQVASVTAELRAQSTELAEQQKQVLESLEELSMALTSSTGDLDRTATSLTTISERFEAASAALSDDLSKSSTTLETVFAKLEEQAQRGAELTDQTTALSAHVSDASTNLLDASTSMSAQLQEFNQVQTTFRTELADNATTLADGLRAQVERMSQQVARWLGAYSADVERQIESRMETWNKVSQDYATKMLSTAQALSDAVDELPNKTVAPVEEAA